MRSVMEIDGIGDEPGEPASPSRSLPREFGRYELIEEVARGGMGVVYRAYQMNLDRTIAVKLLLAGGYSSEAILRRFRVEASAAAGLQHPAIVAIHDFGEAEGQPYIAMDLLVGRDLAELSGGRPLASRRAASLLRTLAEAVAHAHEQGVLHRDLKPSNVIVDADDRPCITDFGLAKIAESEEVVTITGLTLGTPGYLAPEQARGSAEKTGPATDIYGLGALLFHLLTGRAPFNAASPLETFQLVLENPAPSPSLFNPSLPRDLVTICLKCLESDPARRYASAADLAEDADRFLTDRPILARPPGKLYRAGKYVRRHGIGVSAVTAVVLALSAGLIASLVSYRSAMEERELANAARVRSEQVVEGILNDLQPHLQAAGRQEAVVASIETALRYFDQLPPEMRDRETRRKHARELDRLVRAHYYEFMPGTEEALRKAAVIWQELASSDPHDAEAADAALWAEVVLSGQNGVVRDETKLRERYRSNAERYRELEQRFPDQAGLGFHHSNVLGQWAQFELNFGQFGIARDLLREGRRVIDRATVLEPQSDDILLGKIYFLNRSRSFYDRLGQSELGRQQIEHALEISNALLKEDPANLRYLFRTAELINDQVLTATPSEMEARIDEVRVYLEKLMLLDPNNAKWIGWEASLLVREGFLFASDRRNAEASVCIEAAMQISTSQSRPDYSDTVVRSFGLLGVMAARSNDPETAREYLRKLIDAPDIALRVEHPPRSRRNEFDRHLAACNILVELQDWPRLEEVARVFVWEFNPDNADLGPQNSVWGDLDLAPEADYVRALVMQGRHEEAMPWLEKTMKAFTRPYGYQRDRFIYPQSRRWETAEVYSDALYQIGDYERAVEWQGWALAEYEKHVAMGGKLLSRIATARCAWKLAERLDDSDGETIDRRRELLDRAVELLDASDTEPRLLPDERDMREEIEAARTLILPRTFSVAGEATG